MRILEEIDTFDDTSADLPNVDSIKNLCALSDDEFKALKIAIPAQFLKTDGADADVVKCFEETRAWFENKGAKIEVVDLQQSYKRKQMKGHFSFALLEKMKQTLDAGEQIILFQNRRGFSPYIECKICAWNPRCPHCDVSLSYHKNFDKLVCHYCGHTEKLPTKCPSCEQETLQHKGFGTEQIEEELESLFPNITVRRMDIDTTRSKKSYENIISDFAMGKANILVGTQIVSKGLDFDNVGLVGILNADNLLNYPNFRAYERAFQMLMQVSGRAGRRQKQGNVVLQTFSPEHPIIQFVKTADYQSFFEQKILMKFM